MTSTTTVAAADTTPSASAQTTTTDATISAAAGTTGNTATVATDATRSSAQSDTTLAGAVGTSAAGAIDTTSRSVTEIAAATTGASDIASRLTEWRLGSAELQADLDRSATIVRTKDSVVGAPTGATDDSVLETMVKGKIQADAEVSSAMIEVKAQNGEVTLKGSADNATQIGRAIALALDTQGVTKVSSDIKVNAQAKK